MVNLIIIVLLLFFAYLNFGLVLVGKTKLKLTYLEKALFAVVLSVSILISLIVFLGHLVGDKSYYLLLISSLIGLGFFKENIPIYKDLFLSFKKQILLSSFLILGALILSSGMFFSGYVKDGQIYLQDLYDTNWHMALERAVLKDFPPEHPSSSGLILKNYHYFYDVFLASLHFFSGVSFVTLNYKISQLFIAFLLIFSTYAFGKRLKDKNTGLILVGLTVFVGNFGYMIPWFLPNHSWSESSFWVSQTFSMMVNPQLIFSFATMYLVILLMTKDFIDVKARHFLIIPLIACSIGFKTYGWMIMSLLYAFDLLLELIFKKDFFNIIFGLIYLIVALPFIYLITGFKSGSFFWQPLWYLDGMVEAPDRVNNIRWRFLLDHYLMKKDFPRLYWLRIKELFIFYFGNLGVRSFFILMPLIALKESFKKQKRVIQIVLLGFVFTSVFPLLFLQTGTVWNSIQFWYYTLIFADILLALSLSGLMKHLNRPFKYLILISLFALGIPAFLKTMQQKFVSFHTFSIKQINLLGKFEEKDRILICPEDTYLFNMAFVRAHSNADIYLADKDQLSLVEADLKQVNQLKDIFSKQSNSELLTLVDQQKIRYILCSDSGMTKFLDKNYLDKKSETLNWSLYSLK